MKKGLIGPYQLGTLSGMSGALKIAEDVTSQPGVDIEGIFYSIAFQAGVDEFLVSKHKDIPVPNSNFISERTTYIEKGIFEDHWNLVDREFSSYLPDNWHQNDEFRFVWRLHAFLVEILDAMSLGSSVLSPSGIPDFSEAESQLPSELATPISILLSAITDLQTPSPVPLKAIPTEDVQRYNDILSGSVFTQYVEAQSELDNSDSAIEKILPTIAAKGRELFVNNKKLLALKRSNVGILKITPKIIDAAFGKLPGALSEAAAKLGINLLESRRRVVIYDFHSTTRDILISNLMRMVKAADIKSGGKGSGTK